MSHRKGRSISRAAPTTLAACVVLGVASCGGDDSATKTVTVPAETVTVAAGAPTTDSPEPADDAGTKTKSAGPPLPAGVVGVDGKYALKNVNTDRQAPYIRDTAAGGYYNETSSAATRCDGSRCSVNFRLGLESGGYKSYTLTADPRREGTYVGTAKGRVKCLTGGDRFVSSRERVAVRTGAVTDIDGRQVASRLSVYITTTTLCGGEPAKEISLLRGPRQP